MHELDLIMTSEASRQMIMVFFLQLCTEYKLVVCNIFYQRKPIHKVTWIHSRAKHGHALEYVICKGDIQDMCTLKVMQGADCDTCLCKSCV